MRLMPDAGKQGPRAGGGVAADHPDPGLSDRGALRFVAPLSQYRQEMIDLREEEARFRAIAQQRDAIREALAQVRDFETSNPGFLTEANFDLAASSLIQRLQEQVDVLQAATAAAWSAAPVPWQRAGAGQSRRQCFRYAVRTGHDQGAAAL